MTRNSSLTTFLMISILVILMGIFLVIVTQFDNKAGFVIPDSFQQEQSSIIEQVYKIRSQQNSLSAGPEQTKATAPITQQAAQALQAQVDKYPPKLIPAPQIDTAYGVWPSNPEQVTQPYYSLKNNPWSPEYSPGYQ